MKTKVKITFLTNAIYSNPRAMDPLDDDVKALKRITGKKKKVDADHKEIYFRQWIISLYTLDGKLVVPGKWVGKGLQIVARREKAGKDVEKGLLTIDDAVLNYEGSKKLEKLYEDKKFRWIRPGARGVMIVNAVIPVGSWFETEIEYDENIFDERKLLAWLPQVRLGASLQMICGNFGRIKVEKL